MNKFTLIVHNKGWTVKAACEYWGVRYETFNKRCNSERMHNQLECMCLGLEDRSTLYRFGDSTTEGKL